MLLSAAEPTRCTQLALVNSDHFAAGVVGPEARGGGFAIAHAEKRVGLACVGKMRHQAAAANDPATQRIAQLAADLAQHAALALSATHGVAQLGIDPPEVGRRVLHEPADLGHARHFAQPRQRAVGRAAREVVDVRAGAESVGFQRAPGQAVIGAEADVAPVQVEVRNGRGFIAGAGGFLGLVADTRACFTADAVGLRGL